MYIKETITQYACYLTVHGRISILTSPTRTDAPWGIARLSQDDTLEDQNATDLAFTYKYDSAAGEGVDIYIVGKRYKFLDIYSVDDHIPPTDTGNPISHSDFRTNLLRNYTQASIQSTSV